MQMSQQQTLLKASEMLTLDRSVLASKQALRTRLSVFSLNTSEHAKLHKSPSQSGEAEKLYYTEEVLPICKGSRSAVCMFALGRTVFSHTAPRRLQGRRS